MIAPHQTFTRFDSIMPRSRPSPDAPALEETVSARVSASPRRCGHTTTPALSRSKPRRVPTKSTSPMNERMWFSASLGILATEGNHVTEQDHPRTPLTAPRHPGPKRGPIPCLLGHRTILGHAVARALRRRKTASEFVSTPNPPRNHFLMCRGDGVPLPRPFGQVSARPVDGRPRLAPAAEAQKAVRVKSAPSRRTRLTETRR